mmetsp:Transcript_73694/g.204978  ORF Transcript_73694/g.204978 Transcript_73694/m.204978 type:complete len:427 (-) Transcript_73694:47-1327(-)
MRWQSLFAAPAPLLALLWAARWSLAASGARIHVASQTQSRAGHCLLQQARRLHPAAWRDGELEVASATANASRDPQRTPSLPQPPTSLPGAHPEGRNKDAAEPARRENASLPGNSLVPDSKREALAARSFRNASLAPVLPVGGNVSVTKHDEAPVARSSQHEAADPAPHAGKDAAKGQPRKSKIILLTLEVTMLGMLGFDRMYMGQFWAGCAKLQAFVIALVLRYAGHFLHDRASGRILDHFGLCLVLVFVWDIYDYCLVLHSCLVMSDRIAAFGFYARFSENNTGETVAFWLAAAHAFSIILGCGTNALALVIWRLDVALGSRLGESRLAERPGRRRVPKNDPQRAEEVLRQTRMDICGDREPQEPCPICLDAITAGQAMQTLPCFHLMHHDCATMHFSQRHAEARCPVCRHAIVAGEPVDVVEQ